MFFSASTRGTEPPSSPWSRRYSLPPSSGLVTPIRNRAFPGSFSSMLTAFLTSGKTPRLVTSSVGATGPSGLSL